MINKVIMERILKFTHSTVLDSYPFAIQGGEHIKTISKCIELLNLYTKDTDIEGCLLETESKIDCVIIAIENYLYS